MKKLFILFCVLFIVNSFAQNSVYKYQLYIDNYTNPPTFQKIGNQLIYSGTNSRLQSFLANYTILNFYQLYPASKRSVNLKVFQIETTSKNLFSELLINFPTDFSGGFDVTDAKYELAYYPNDYGNTNPNGNVGANIDRSDLDYINIQKAWDITTGNITIGLSDARINITNADFSGKVSFLNPNWNQFTPFINDIYHVHGTHVGGIAAAAGDNGVGSLGVCYNCNIKSTAYANYNNLLLLAQAGVKVINMSWVTSSYNVSEQNVIDEIVSGYNVVLVAAAGNTSSYRTLTEGSCADSYWDASQGRYLSTIIGTQYRYPASYNNVISVSSIAHKYLPTATSNIISVPSLLGIPIATNVKDSFSYACNVFDTSNPIGLIYSGYTGWCTPPQYPFIGIVSNQGIAPHNTSNPLVDILAPTHDIFSFNNYVEQNAQIFYYDSGGTSSSTPYVSGTAALMLSVNNCLNFKEVEAILKLTTKDVENMPINQNFIGNIGAGALNAGNAVEFTNEMKKSNGNAVIRNHIFNRFDYVLDKINNKLTIENITFKEACKTDFIAKNQIILSSGTNLKPNTVGSCHLGINPNIDITCAPIPAVVNRKPSDLEPNSTSNLFSKTILYPNPNKGSFHLYNIKAERFGYQEIELNIYDLNGRSLYFQKINNNELDSFHVNLENFNKGVYLVRLSSSSYSEDLKFIKN